MEGAGWAGAGVKGEWVMVGTRLGHLRGLLERKSHAPCLLLPTIVPSFDCASMNNAWRMGLKDGEGLGWEGRGDLNLKGTLPQWESLPMNNHTDEPQREREQEGEKTERERWEMNGKEKQTRYKKKK